MAAGTRKPHLPARSRRDTGQSVSLSADGEIKLVINFRTAFVEPDIGKTGHREIRLVRFPGNGHVFGKCIIGILHIMSCPEAPVFRVPGGPTKSSS